MHVPGPEIPPDCVERFVSVANEAVQDGHHWLRLELSRWPNQSSLISTPISKEERSVCHLATKITWPIILFDCFFSFTVFKSITAWVLRFIKNAHPSYTCESCPHLTVLELVITGNYWISIAQIFDIIHDTTTEKSVLMQ